MQLRLWWFVKARDEREREKKFIIQRDSSMRECVFLLPVHFFRVGIAHEQCKRRLSDAANDTRARGASHAPRTEERRRNKEESFERLRPHHLPCRQSIMIFVGFFRLLKFFFFFFFFFFIFFVCRLVLS